MPNKHEILSSDEESIHEDSHGESHEESHGESQVETTTPDKKKKLSFEDYVNDHMVEFNKFKSELEQASMKDFYKSFTKFVKTQETFMGRLVKLHEKSGRKTKRKHTENTGKSGFNKPTPVPSAFLKYLDLEDETEMTRPQLVKLLNVKFTEDGFKNDGEVCLNSKKVAKMFGVDKDYTFHAKDYHKFIATYYKPSKSSDKSKSSGKSAKT